ncbi:Hypothetical predicted protein [Octopus vulgaris]|uniref:Uncharacterized protein n=1 Tax=Octopus vulgaris TaxID=6645 RepID=A0AA36AZN5_OCTVU|nr:Hypothetical predicted protein [Octopus vulgaris]
MARSLATRSERKELDNGNLHCYEDLKRHCFAVCLFICDNISYESFNSGHMNLTKLCFTLYDFKQLVLTVNAEYLLVCLAVLPIFS